MCVWCERERERESVCVLDVLMRISKYVTCVRENERVHERERECVCLHQRENTRMSERNRLCV